jgi:hypothetical protein
LLLSCASLDNTREIPTELIWEEYPESYTDGFRVCQKKRAKLNFDLQASTISNNDYIFLNVKLNSTVSTVTDGLKQRNFELLTPWVSINGHGGLFGKIRIPVKKYRNYQNCSVKIKTKYLKPGQNTLEFSAGFSARKLNYGCYGYNVILVSLGTESVKNSSIAQDTRYIEIKRDDTVYEYGEPKFKVHPGDTLQILRTKTCRGGVGICYKVKNVDTGEIGYVVEKRMTALHNIYSSKD